MPVRKVDSTDDITNQIVSLLHQRLPEQSKIIETFVRLYYQGVSTRDLPASNINGLYNQVLTHWGVASNYPADATAKVRVYNPQQGSLGWESTHTIVEVVTRDAPFLVDSVRMAINRNGSANHLAIHPVMNIERDAQGNFLRALQRDKSSETARLESFMFFEIDRQNDESALAQLQAQILQSIQDVHTIVGDYQAMSGRLENILAQIGENTLPISDEEREEGTEFLNWLQEGNFVFLGYREHDLTSLDGEDQLSIVSGSSLGILRRPNESEDASSLCASFASMPPQARRLAHKPELLVITRSGSESTVHRPGYMDYIGIKKFNKQGKVTGEHRFLGLYTQVAYTRDTHRIPILRRKVENVFRDSGYRPDSHAGRALAGILETYPRDEMFQITQSELLDIALGILQLQERQKTTLFLRTDPYGRFYSCLVFIPRDHFNTDVRQQIGDILLQELNGKSIKFSVKLSESVLVRVHFIIHIAPGTQTEHDVEQIEADIVAAIRPWRDYLHDALVEEHAEEEGNNLYRRYRKAFRADYQESYTPRQAVFDLRRIRKMQQPGDIDMALFAPADASHNQLRFKLFSYGQPVPLSDVLPMLENMGLKVIDEHPSKVRSPDGGVIWIQDFGLQHNNPDLVLDDIKDIFQDAFPRIFSGAVANDGFNRLTLRAHLGWRRVLILRAYASYLRQLRGTFSQNYMIQALVSNPDIATLLIELFEARFDPAASEARAEVCADIENRILQALDNVSSLDEDRIIRNFSGAISASIRTNYYQPDIHGVIKSYLSFKVDSLRVPDMPAPRPKYEIFVYSPRVEGIHLRGGSVARGGLRWSDRAEDFRTEVLGLVKAQMVKNAVIVPSGSKGGFVAKQLPTNGDREQILAEGIACYRLFICGLLDLTDNIIDGIVHPPVLVVRHDSDDPYLVVAADKGTATFSDIANEVAASYQFWLGDAFASGGSVGYDHKAMGITARGAWESVKRQFRELDLDTDRDEFSVVGIGDMSGDVFGNGMLLSRKIKLLAAFNHQHIFLDPNPDCEQSFVERQRMFNLPRSSWEDYNKDLISAGGGIFSRSAKKITLSAEVQAMLGCDDKSMDPNELIRSLLKAEVDLLWNGGIGTYVKATHEQHADVGDRTNEALRINGNELRCRVVGEGGNLGLTQLGRVEYARHQGHIYTDAIDNSGGVDCSDHEVNIKILLNAAIYAQQLTIPQRNELLATMTDEVGLLVLRNNYLQTQSLSLASAHAAQMIEVHARLIRSLELSGALNRKIEYLPSEEILMERMSQDEGLTSPELAVVMAYVKIGLYDQLINSDLPDEPYLEGSLVNYFPTALRSTYRIAMDHHRLRREIIATEMANGMINRAGITFAYRMSEETSGSASEIAKAYIIVREILGLNPIWAEIEALDGVVSAQTQMSIYFDTRKLLERAVRWIIQNRPMPLAIEDNINRYHDLLQHLASLMMSPGNGYSGDHSEAKSATLMAAGVPETLAIRISTFDALSFGLELVETAVSCQIDLDIVVAVYNQTGNRLHLNWLRNSISNLPRNTHWQAIARGSLRDDLLELHKLITVEVLYGVPVDTRIDALSNWINSRKVQADHCNHLITELRNGAAPDFTMLSVVLRELRSMLKPTIYTPLTAAQPGALAEQVLQ